MLPKADPGLVLERVSAGADHELLGGADDAADDVRAPVVGRRRPELAHARAVRRLAGAGTGGPGVAGPRRAAAAGLRHDRGVARRVHGHPRRHARPPDRRSGCRTSSPTSRCCATAGPSRSRAHRPSWLVRGPHVFAGYWNRPEETAAFVDGRSRRAGSAPATCCASTTTAGRTSSTGSRTCTSPAARTSTPPRWRPSRPSSTPSPTAPSSASPTPGGARSASPTCSCARGPRSTETSCAPTCEANLARYKVPKHLEFVAELPRNATGKIRRVELRRRAADEHPDRDRPHRGRKETS